MLVREILGSDLVPCVGRGNKPLKGVVRKMKKPYLSLDGIKRAVRFLEKRKAHASETGNTEWAAEYENAIRIIRSLCALELEPEETKPGRR